MYSLEKKGGGTNNLNNVYTTGISREKRGTRYVQAKRGMFGTLRDSGRLIDCLLSRQEIKGV